jgi:hypothetical protein
VVRWVCYRVDGFGELGVCILGFNYFQDFCAWGWGFGCREGLCLICELLLVVVNVDIENAGDVLVYD